MDYRIQKEIDEFRIDPFMKQCREIIDGPYPEDKKKEVEKSLFTMCVLRYPLLFSV